MTSRKRGRKAKAEDPRVKELERENARLQRRLARVETMLEIQKKTSELLGIRIGNIQAAEALFRARIHPEHAANTLAREEVARLARSIRSSLRSEIERSRSETLTYLQAGGENFFVVYGRGGKPCSRCGTLIAKLVQGGRSSYYCPSCQSQNSFKTARKSSARV